MQSLANANADGMLGQVRITGSNLVEVKSKCEVLNTNCKTKGCEIKQIRILEQTPEFIVAMVAIGPLAGMTPEEFIKAKLGKNGQAAAAAADPSSSSTAPTAAATARLAAAAAAAVAKPSLANAAAIVSSQQAAARMMAKVDVSTMTAPFNDKKEVQELQRELAQAKRLLSEAESHAPKGNSHVEELNTAREALKLSQRREHDLRDRLAVATEEATQLRAMNEHLTEKLKEMETSYGSQESELKSALKSCDDLKEQLTQKINAVNNLTVSIRQLAWEVRKEVCSWQEYGNRHWDELKDVSQSLVQFAIPFANPSMVLQDERMKAMSKDTLALGLRSMTEKLLASEARCKLLHNQVQELKGNIRVYCRIRPLTNAEIANGTNIVVKDDNAVSILRAEREDGSKENKEFVFDRAFPSYTRQETVFEETAPLVKSVLDGYNVCIFAYGQTGSGKTHTLLGDYRGGSGDGGEEQGLTFRALKSLVAARETMADTVLIKIRLSMFEIYNETLQDLLGNDSTKLSVLGIPGEYIRIQGLSEHEVHSVEKGVSLIQSGITARSTASTKMNQRSSRSHLLVLFMLDCHDLLQKTQWSSKLYMIDLAGSEDVSKSGATGSTLREAVNINKSLSALHDVMGALGSSKTQHIPFRNSKLTHVLSDSLGGKAKTLMYVMISPSPDQGRETMASLNFANRCKNVTLGPAIKAERHKEGEGDDASKKQNGLRLEIEKLQFEIDDKSKQISALEVAEKKLRKHIDISEKFEEKLADYLNIPSANSNNNNDGSMIGNHEHQHRLQEILSRLATVVDRRVTTREGRRKSPIPTPDTIIPAVEDNFPTISSPSPPLLMNKSKSGKKMGLDEIETQGISALIRNARAQSGITGNIIPFSQPNRR